MSWYDYFNPWEQTKYTWNKLGLGDNPIETHPAPPGSPTTGTAPDGRPILTDTGLPAPYGVDEGMRQAYAAQQAGRAGMFADQAQQGYAAYGAQGQSALAALQRQASGQDSVSAEQLRQGLGQQLAQQRSMAAGASPRNAAGAARTAAIQMGRASTAMAGQQAVAGQQERNQANAAYGNLASTMRGQDLQAALQSRSNANAGYGASAGPPQKDWKDYAIPAATAAATIIAASDRRLKTDLGPGDDKANAAIDKLQPYAYRYKDPQAYGTGPQIGTTTQDLARAGLQQAVIKTPAGEMVDAGKLSGANTAMIAALGRRVAELEGTAAPGSPAAQKAGLLARRGRDDPQGEAAQRALDGRRARIEDNNLYAAGAYPTREPPDTRAIQAQQALDRRRAVLAALARGAQLTQGPGGR